MTLMRSLKTKTSALLRQISICADKLTDTCVEFYFKAGA
jgi:hypothetical protein